MRFRKQILINIVVTILSFTLVTPLSIYTVVRPLSRSFEETGNQLLAFAAQWTSPVIIAGVNIVIIPFFIDISAILLSFETFSEL